jgi:xylitol oxidase
MSTAYDRASVALHFTWKPAPEAVADVLVHLERVLAPFEARPHWGKVFRADAAAIAPLYERHADFVALVERMDPRGAFRNAWFEQRVLGG